MSWSASKAFTHELEPEEWSTNPAQDSFTDEVRGQFEAAEAAADRLVLELGRPCTVYLAGHVNGGESDPVNPTHVTVKVEIPIV